MYSNFGLILILVINLKLSNCFNYDLTSKLEIVGKPITISDFMDDWNYFVHVECQKACGGVLINPQWVITTADCIRIQNCTINLGSTYLDDIDGDESIELMSSRTIRHPSYEPDNPNKIKLYNIGLIQLSTKVRLSRKINTITLTQEIPINSANCYAVSWSGDIFPISIYKADLTKSQVKSCTYLTNVIDRKNAQICDHLGVLVNDNDTGLTSTLHSGAALMCKNYFYGILSSSGFNDEYAYFTVWTYLLGYLDWINDNLKNYGAKPINVIRGLIRTNVISIQEPHITRKTKPPLLNLYVTENYEEKSNFFFDNERLDPYAIYLNHTFGQKRKTMRKYNPRFGKLNTLLRKAETGMHYDDMEDVSYDMDTDESRIKRMERKAREILRRIENTSTILVNKNNTETTIMNATRNEITTNKGLMDEKRQSMDYMDVGSRLAFNLYYMLFWAILMFTFSNYSESL